MEPKSDLVENRRPPLQLMETSLFGENVSSGIYRIVHLASGRGYVGQAQDVPKRLRDHLLALDRGTHHNHHLQRAWDKYGRSGFSWGLIESCQIDQLDAREQFWIDNSDSRFNICKFARSTRGVFHSPEAKAKVSAFQKGRKKSAETRARMSAAAMGNQKFLGKKLSPEHKAKLTFKGRSHSQETIERIAEAKRGKKLSDEHRAKLSEALKGRRNSPEAIEKTAASHRGRKRSPEARLKMSIARKRYFENRKRDEQEFTQA